MKHPSSAGTAMASSVLMQAEDHLETGSLRDLAWPDHPDADVAVVGPGTLVARRSRR